MQLVRNWANEHLDAATHGLLLLHVHLRDCLHICTVNVMTAWFIALAGAVGLLLVWSGLTTIL